MALGRVSLKTHQTGWAVFHQRPQFPECLLRFSLREVLIVDPAKLIKAARACSVATFFRIAECAEVALSEIELALAAARNSDDARFVAHCEAQLPKARSVFERLYNR